jgi:hypothetical protein
MSLLLKPLILFLLDTDIEETSFPIAHLLASLNCSLEASCPEVRLRLTGKSACSEVGQEESTSLCSPWLCQMLSFLALMEQKCAKFQFNEKGGCSRVLEAAHRFYTHIC